MDYLKIDLDQNCKHKSHRITQTLSQFVINLSYSNIPNEVIEFTKLCILDIFGSAFAAVGLPISIAASKFLDEGFGIGEATRWDKGQKTSVLGATWINSTLGSAIDIDDGHRMAVGHPGSSIIPAAIAVAENENLDGKKLLEAIISGYEVAIRVSRSRDPFSIENLATGQWGVFGAAIAASKLLSNSTLEIENTLGLAAMYGPRLQGFLPGGRRMVKEGISWAALAGVSSALLTRSGFTGPQEIFDHLKAYRPLELLEGLGEEFLILKTYFKIYPCCRWIHPIIDGCLAVMEEKHFDLSQLRRIRIQTFLQALNLPNRVRPQTIEEAQFSIPFCCALAMVKKEKGFRHILLEDLNNPEIIKISEKITLELNSEFNKVFPEKIFSKIIFEIPDGNFEKVVSSTKGDPENPFSVLELQEKYMNYASPFLGKENAERLMKLIKEIENNQVKDLMKLISIKSF